MKKIFLLLLYFLFFLENVQAQEKQNFYRTFLGALDTLEQNFQSLEYECVHIDNLKPEKVRSAKILIASVQQRKFFRYEVFEKVDEIIPLGCYIHIPLEILYIDCNGICGGNVMVFPSGVKHLKNLKVLIMRGCYLQILPNEIGYLKILKNLVLSHNQLQFLPEEFANLENLLYLDLGEAKFRIFPKQITKLKNLKKLRLYNNKIDFLPAQIGELENLIYLDLYGNELKTLPEEISNLKNLKNLSLGKNPISKKEQEKIRKLLPNCQISF